MEGKNSKKKIKRQNPTIVFLQETKCSTERIEEVSKKIWKGSEGMGIDTRGFARGLVILWDSTRVTLGDYGVVDSSYMRTLKWLNSRWKA